MVDKTQGSPQQTFAESPSGRGRMILGDSLKALEDLDESSVDLVVTSPPFGLVRQKDYGNVAADGYVDWFRGFAPQLKRVLKRTGSLVIDIGGAWVQGQPTRSLYHFKLLIMLVDEFGFHLAQDFYWWNPAKLPTPAEWVTVRRVRVKDAVNTVWWLSVTPWPKASNRRVLQPYSESMLDLLENGYDAGKRPSGHDISEKFLIDNGAAIPPNLIAAAHTESNSRYLRFCRERGIRPHPARFPAVLPEYFVRMLTDPSDLVVDPFAGSCMTGEVCERLGRRWVCIELEEEYLKGALGRFIDGREAPQENGNVGKREFYQLPRVGLLWKDTETSPLASDGGRKRPRTPRSVTGEASALTEKDTAEGPIEGEAPKDLREPEAPRNLVEAEASGGLVEGEAADDLLRNIAAARPEASQLPLTLE